MYTLLEAFLLFLFLQKSAPLLVLEEKDTHKHKKRVQKVMAPHGSKKV